MELFAGAGWGRESIRRSKVTQPLTNTITVGFICGKDAVTNSITDPVFGDAAGVWTVILIRRASGTHRQVYANVRVHGVRIAAAIEGR